MGFFSTLTSLLDESSDQAFEKKLTAGLDKIEKAIGGSLDKAESSVKKVENISQRAATTIDTVDKQLSKVSPQQNNT